MHILALIAVVLAGLAFWWFRLRGIGATAGDIVEAAEQVGGAIRRRRIRRGAQLSPISAIDDPVIAAGVILATFATLKTPPGPGREEAVRHALATIADAAAVDEAVRYGFWATAQFAEGSTVIAETAALVADWLDEAERAHLCDLALSVAHATKAPPAETTRHAELLRRKLGLRPA